MDKGNISMNKVVSTIMNHRSFRKYTDRQIKNEDLNAIIRSAQTAPSWVNGQHVTIIAIKDPERKQRFAELSGNQKHIRQAPVFLVFCADFHRTKLACQMEGVEFKASQNIDLLLVGTVDVGISLANAITTAESLGLGTVPIGGIRRSSLQMVELLNLPEYVIPISGLCIGYPNEQPSLKPRLPKAAVYHEEQYDGNDNEILEMISDYNQLHRDYNRKRTNGRNESNWSQSIARFYSEPYYVNNSYQDVREMLHKQGFSIGELNTSKK